MVVSEIIIFDLSFAFAHLSSRAAIDFFFRE
jgi:hypothetical protein